jgi:hypothetical protein
MKLKNSDILWLVNTGLLNTTEHDLPAGHAVYAFKFRRAIKKALGELADQEAELAKNEADEAKRRELVKALHDQETEIGEVKRMPLESYMILAAENRQTPVYKVGTDGNPVVSDYFDTFRVLEDFLAGILYDNN